MSSSEDRLSKEEHSRILREKVIPEANLESLTSHERPKAIILAGQPGAGKGGLKTAVELELSGDVAAIDPDGLRDYHPEARNWRKSSPYGWSQQTNADAGQSTAAKTSSSTLRSEMRSPRPR
jgi:hypothetical protein